MYMYVYRPSMVCLQTQYGMSISEECLLLTSSISVPKSRRRLSAERSNFKILSTFFIIGDTCLIYLPFIFIPVSGCVGRGPSALLFPGVYNTVKTDLSVALR